MLSSFLLASYKNFNPSKLLSLTLWFLVCIANHTKLDWYAQIKKLQEI